MNKIPSALIAAALHVAPKNDVRFYLNGVLIESHADGAIIVATDGHRMLVVRTSLPWDIGKIIVPRDPLGGWLSRNGINHETADGVARAEQQARAWIAEGMGAAR
ncbi:TPA: hypothetical protein RNT26_000596 [Stenotrophomonas maltophilia]|nr:hypothetical protein [Stenotrophomonas maltophilia]